MNGRSAVTAAIGLILGLLAGLAIGSVGNESAELPAAAPVVDELNPPGSRDAEPLSPDFENEEGKTGSRWNSLAEVIASVEVPSVPQGEGRITGRVLSNLGSPVSGVEIVARPSYPEPRRSSSSDLEERVRESIRYERWRSLSDRSASTDADGNYELSGLDELSDYNLWASLEGWRLSADEQTGKVQAGDARNYTATRVFKISVRVVKSDGALVGPARIDVDATERGQSSRQHYLQSGAGDIECYAGAWTLTAKAGNNYEYRSEPLSLEFDANSSVTEIVLQVKGEPGVLGVVTRPQEHSGSPATVYLLAGSFGSAPVDLSTARLQRTDEARVYFHQMGDTSEARGEFSFRSLKPGQYRLVLEFDGEIVNWREVTVADELVELEFNIPAADRSAYFIVRVLSSDGKPLPGAVANLKLVHDEGWQTAGGSYSEEGEAVWIKRAQPADSDRIAHWWYELSATHKEYGTLIVRVERDSPSEHEFQFSAPGTLTLHVGGYNDHELVDSMHWSLVRTGERGEGLSRNQLRDRKRRGGQDSARSPLTFGPVQPGSYDAVLTVAEEYGSRELARHAVTVAAGENSLRVATPALYKLAVRCESSREARQLNLTLAGERVWTRTDSEDPRVAQFANLAPGTYVLRSPAGTMTVTVPASGEVEFAPRMYDCAVLSDINAGGIVEGLGLRNGDKLTAIDGEPFESPDTFQAQMMLSLAKDSTTWTLIRNGATIDVSFNGKKLMETMENKSENGERLDIDPGYQVE